MMRGAIVETGSPTASSFGCGAWLAVALREQERRAVASRLRVGKGSHTGTLAAPRIDRAACADWLATASLRDRGEAGR
jgi:hypothetical protein